MIILVFSLCACTDAGRAEKICDEFSDAQKIVLTAFVRADYGDKVFDFKITCTDTPEETSVEIKEPAEIAGVYAAVTDDGYRLEYDGVVMTTGAVTRNGLSPMEALPCLISAWKDGYFTAALSEKYGDTDALMLESRITDTVHQKTWFDKNTLLPLRSEILQSGRTVITCEFENVIVE